MIQKLKPKSEFSKNVLILMTGTTIAQAIPIAISPILTRIYTPEDFGIYALYIAIVGFIAIAVTARYEMAIVLPRSDEDAINIVFLSLLIMTSIVTLLFLIILLFKEDLLSLLNAKSIGNFLYLIPFSVLIAGLTQIFNYWSNRKKYFKNISSSQISQSLAIGISQPIFGYFNIFGGLIVGNLVGRVISTFVLIDKFLKSDKESIKDINRQIMFEQMRKYKDFPLVNSLQSLSEVTRINGSVMLISSFFGSTVLGFYALSLRVLQVPIGIISSALGQVLYKEFTVMYNNNENLYLYVKKIIFTLILIASPLFFGLYYIVPDLFSFIFGEKWRIAGEFSKIFIPYMFIGFLVSPIYEITIVIEKQKLFFYIGLVANIGVLFIIIVGHFFNFDIIKILYLISILLSLVYISILLTILKLLKNKVKDLKC